MAPLPAARVGTTAPFYHSGIDLAGPFLVKKGAKGIHKWWIVILTCFQTRAVHTEIVNKYDSSCVIKAITRFSSRRPGLRVLYSDRGPNLRAAAKNMTKELAALNRASEAELFKHGIKWEFNPPYAPHRGGVWERVVGLLKKLLLNITKGDIIQIDVFTTIVVETEGILNRGPLTHISTDSKDVAALTPNNFLAPAASAAEVLFDISPSSSGSDLRVSWKHAIAKVNSFWRAFRSDYLSLLHSREKWKTTKTDLKVSDLVILVDDSKSRNDWKLGRVESIISTGPHARQVVVRTANGKTTPRDRSKVVRLELDE